MAAWLEERTPGKLIRLHRLGDRAFLGSDGGSAAPIAGARVPPVQCTIERQGDVWRLRDVRRRRRGTLVNCRYVRDVALVPGDQVQVGETVLKFRRSGEPAKRSLRRDSCR